MEPIERIIMIYKDEIPLEQYFAAYFDCRKHKRGTMNALAFELNYEEELVKLHDEVMRREYEIGSSIAFVVTRPKKREVFAADFRDRVIHHLVMRKIEPLFENSFIEDNYNCRIGKGNLYGLKRLHERLTSEGRMNPDTYIGKFDMQGFFMSIHKPTLWDMIKKLIDEQYKEFDKDTVLYLLEKIILHCPETNCVRKSPSIMWRDIPNNKTLFRNGADYGLPIGNLSSQMFANYYLHEMDTWLDEKFIYGRYVDDFYLIGDKKEILNVIPLIRERLHEININLHPRKWYLQHWTKGCKFLGGVSKCGRLYVGKQTVYNSQIAVDEINEAIDKKEYIEEVTQRINSYLGYFGQFMTYGIRRDLIESLSREWYRYFYISGPSKKAVIRQYYKPTQILKREIHNQRILNNN